MSKDAKSFLEELNTLFTRHERTMFDYHKKFFDDYIKLLDDVKVHGSANKIINIEEGKEYDDIVFSIHCVKSNSSDCEIITHYSEVSFPPGSFVKGAMYSIDLQKLKKSGGAEFIAYIS